jgi:hypothetical protein
VPPSAAYTVKFGGPPDPSDYLPGGIWLWGYVEAGSDTLLSIDVYAYGPPNAIDWGDGAWEDATGFTVDTPVAGNTPGIWTISHDYGRAGIWRGYVESPRSTFNVDIGDIPVWDPDKREKMWTPAQREADERAKSASIQRDMKVPVGNRRR